MNPKDEVFEPVSPLHSEYHVTSLLEVAQDLVVQGGARGRPGCSFSPAVAGFTLLCLVPTFIAIFYCSFRQFVYVSLVFLLYTLDSRYLGSPPLLVVFTVSFLYFSVSFVRCRIFFFNCSLYPYSRFFTFKIWPCKGEGPLRLIKRTSKI